MKKMKLKRCVCLLVLVLLSSFAFGETSDYDESLDLVIDGQSVGEDVNLVLKDDRVLVPLRFVSEYLGGEVMWQPKERRVDISKDNATIRVWIDSHLIAYGDGTYGVSDVSPVIINDSTYVPVRLVANALGVEVAWDGLEKCVVIDSQIPSDKTAFYDLKILSHENNASIKGETHLQMQASKEILEQAASVKLLLVDQETARGYVVSESKTDLENLSYLPRLSDQGDKVWVVAYYDDQRKWVAGTSIAISTGLDPKATLSVQDRSKNEALVLKSGFNFMPYKVSYRLTHKESQRVSLVEVADPFNTYKWSVGGLKNGSYDLVSIVYDHTMTPYESAPVQVDVEVAPYLYLSGVRAHETISGEVYLIASRNYDVKETIFTIENVHTGEAWVLSKQDWGGYNWLPTKEDVGEYYLRVKVVDVNDVMTVSPGVRVKVDFTPTLSLVGVGPNQILTDDVTLSVKSNMEVSDVKYHIEHVATGKKQILNSEDSTFVPTKDFEGEVKIYAEAVVDGQEKMQTSSVSLKVYLQTLYGPQAIIAKDQFLPFVSDLALTSFESTGMSAALQAAQGILETGWGQSVPVDKYTNQLSYNLFGIKGTGTKGSVVSNTWEVYNGVSFRTDAYFRAYNNVNESWADHKRILLDLSRYQIFRDVMYDSTLGAWAVRRAGYATDPNYPIKLMNIIDRYDLHLLDEVGVH